MLSDGPGMLSDGPDDTAGGGQVGTARETDERHDSRGQRAIERKPRRMLLDGTKGRRIMREATLGRLERVG